MAKQYGEKSSETTYLHLLELCLFGEVALVEQDDVGKLDLQTLTHTSESSPSVCAAFGGRQLKASCLEDASKRNTKRSDMTHPLACTDVHLVDKQLGKAALLRRCSTCRV